MWSHRLLTWRWLLAVCVLVLASLSALRADRLRAEVRLRDFFPQEDPDFALYEEVRAALGAADDVIRLAIPANGGIYRAGFLGQLSGLTQELDSLALVDRVASITTLKKPVITPFGIQWIPYVRSADNSTLAADSSLIAADRPFTGPYVNDQATVATVLLRPLPDLTHDEVSGVLSSTRERCSRAFGDRCFLGGIRHLEISYARISGESLRAVVGYSLLFVLLLLMVLFRSPLAHVLALTVLSLSMLLFLGYMVLADRPFGIMGSLFPTLILIVGLSDVIHLLSRFDSLLERGDDVRDALTDTLHEVGPILVLTSFTTALGLLTFVQSDMLALRQFGWDSAVAVLITLLVTMSMAPVVLSFKLTNGRPVVRRWFRVGWARVANVVVAISSRHRRRVLTTIAVFTAISIAGIVQISTNSQLGFRFSGNRDLAADLRFFEERAGGIRQMQLAVRARPGNSLGSLEILGEILKVNGYLSRDALFSDVISPVTFYRGLERARRPFSRQGVELPATDAALRALEVWAPSFEREMSLRLVDDRRELGIIVASMPDLGRVEVDRVLDSMFEWIYANVDTSVVEFRRTGIPHLVDRGHQHRIDNMLFGLSLAILAVAVVIALLLRDIRMLFASLLVNMLPLIWVAGLMGWVGIEMRGATSMIFAIGFVIAVDDTLHITSAFARRRRLGSSADIAADESIIQTGRGVVTTSLALLGGFVVLLSASFWEVSVFGLLVGCLLAMALPADLLLLPIILRWAGQTAEPTAPARESRPSRAGVQEDSDLD